MQSSDISNQIQEQTDHLFSTILLEQAQINKIMPTDPDKVELLEKSMAKYAPMRGKGFIFPYISSGRGHGPFSENLDGSVKYDLIGGIGPGLLGHSHPIYIKACLEAARQDILKCGNLLLYPESLELTETLINSVPKTRLKHFWFSGSGSFANDCALKILWQKNYPKKNLIAFEKAFAGRSIAMQDITDNPGYREKQPTSLEVFYAPHFDQNNPEGSLNKTLSSLDQIWNKNPDSFCALMMEPIQGEAGFVYGNKEFYQGVAGWAKAKGIHIWIDEVQSFARTHELFAFQMFELDEYVDVVTVGKVLQACGTFYTAELNPKPGLIAGTFNGSLMELRAGKYILEYLLSGGFYGSNGRMQEIESSFFAGFKQLKEKHPNKLNYYGGIGTMLSFEVFEGDQDKSKEFIQKLFKNGIISFTAGRNPTRIRFLVPTALKNDHINHIMQIIDETLEEGE